MSARLVLVAAMDSKRGVGKAGNIPWKAPVDMQRFRALTLGGAVCYGRHTWESLPVLHATNCRMLVDRYNILLTRQPFNPLMFDCNGSIASSVKDALAIVEAQGLGPLYVIGGNQVWAEAIRLAKQGIPTSAHITEVAGDFQCDAFFPKFEGPWTLRHEGQSQQDKEVTTKFQVWESF